MSGPYVRQNRKPPKGERCDAHIGVDPHASQTPTLLRCTNLATVEFKGGPLPFETWLCESCAENIEKRASARKDEK